MSGSLSNSTEPVSHSAKSTILVVDDEKIVRDLCGLALREYLVLQAATCEEAIRI